MQSVVVVSALFTDISYLAEKPQCSSRKESAFSYYLDIVLHYGSTDQQRLFL